VLAELVDGIPAAAATDFPRPPPRGRELFADALGARGRALVHLPAALRRLRAAVAELGSGGTKRLPRSSLNRPIGPRRALAVARADLAAVRAAAHAHGATINDVATWRDEALMLNLASFGPDEHRLLIQAGIRGLKGIVGLDLAAFKERLVRPAFQLRMEPIDDLRAEGWWDQARTLEDE